MITASRAFPTGEPSTPHILELARFADCQWQTGLPDLAAAALVR